MEDKEEKGFTVKGMRERNVAACEINAKSEASCTLAEPSMPQPVVRQARMSL